MAKYELDDELVQRFVSGDSATDHDNLRAAEAHAALAKALAPQIPIPVPVKVGAVVRTLGAFAPLDQPVTFVRWALDHFTHSPWLQANSDTPYRTDEIGRITEVLSPGVDL